MTLTRMEALVIELVRQRRVVTMNTIVAEVHISARTARRALAKCGHCVSINQNASFLTLKSIPRFDRWGLWAYDEVRFSRHGSLAATIVALVDISTNGQTVQELQQRLRTRVHNQLSFLRQTQQLSQCYVGRHAVYLSINRKRRADQEAQRRQQHPPIQTAVGLPEKRAGQLPQGLDAVTVIGLLIQMIQTPEASVASLAKRLQARGIAINAQQIRSVIEFYSLGKKTKP